MMAMIMNRVGDLGLCLGLFLIFILFGSLDYSVVFSLVHRPELLSDHISLLGFELHSLTLISIFLLIGAVGKSAQLGLHT